VPGPALVVAPVSVCVKNGVTLTALAELSKTFQELFEACYALEEVSFPFRAPVGRTLGSIPSCSVALIRIEEP